MPPGKDYYSILGVSKGADENELKKGEDACEISFTHAHIMGGGLPS
jgi:hypothetical protein